MTLTGMLAERITPPMRCPESLTLGAPHDDAGRAAMVDIHSLAYSADLEAGKVTDREAVVLEGPCRSSR